MNATEARRWLAYARSDLEAARALLYAPEPFPRQVCFLAQQTAEKAIKAILVYVETVFPFTHDLDRLRDLVPEGWTVKRTHPDLAELTIWATEARYPGVMAEVAVSEAQNALDIATALYQVVECDLEGCCQ